MPLLETLHVAAAVLWLGNFVVTGVWSLRAFAQRDGALRAFAAREILFTDLVFTLLFGSAVVISGLVLARSESLRVLDAFWTRTALEVVGASGIVWLAVLLPLEIVMYNRARGGRAIGSIFAWWNIVGWLVTAALFCIVYLMIAKPV